MAADLIKRADDVTHLLDALTSHFQRLVDRAAPAAKRIAAIVRVLGVVGLLGGIAAAAALAMPRVGFFESWPAFIVLALGAAFGASIVVRWGGHLRSWTGDVRTTVQRLQAIPVPSDVVSKLQTAAKELAARKDRRSAIGTLVGNARQFRRQLGDIPQFADVAKDVAIQLTGPFRPPLIGPRLAALTMGLIVTVLGPLLLLVAIVVN